MNKVILIGNIATEIDLRYTPNGNAVASFNLAINDRNGEATFIPIETWKKQAENVSQYCGKGSKIAVEGSIKIDKWEKDGQKRTATKVNAFSIQFLESKGGQSSGNYGQSNQQPQSNNQVPQQQSQHPSNPFEQAGEQININDSDLPF